MIRKFNTRLLFTDTESLCYECDEDPREKMYKYKELFDLSNLPANSENITAAIIKTYSVK